MIDLLGSSATNVTNALEKSEFTFFVSGSRYFFEFKKIECAYDEEAVHNWKMIKNLDSTYVPDYDYSAEYSIEIEQFINSIGFTQKFDTMYCDDNTVSVYELIDENGKFQVALKRDIKSFVEVFNAIPIWYYYHYLWKSNPNSYFKPGDIRNHFNMFYKLQGLK